MGASEKLTPGTKRIIERNRQARLLLEWWEATNHPDDADSGLAVDTRKWLAWVEVDVPKLSDSDLLYATDDPETSSEILPEQGHSDTTALSLAHELHHALIRKIDPDALPDDHHRSNTSTPRTDSDSSVQSSSHS